MSKNRALPSGRPLSRRSLLVGLGGLAGLAALAACAAPTVTPDKPAASPPAAAKPTTAAATAPAKAAGPVTITWFAARDATGFTPKQVEEFNKGSTAVQIGYQEQGATTTDLHDKFVTIATAKDPSADLVSADVPFVPEFAAAGWTMSVEDLLPKEERQKFFKGTIEGATYEGTLYGVPWYNNGPGLFYRKDLLDGKSLKPPKTYAELLTMSKTLQAADLNGFIFQASQTEGGIISWLEYLWGYGGDVVDEKLATIVDKDSKGSESLQTLIDFIYKEKIAPESTLTMKTGADAQNVFQEGKAVFLRMWITAASALEGDASKVKGTWAVAPLPSKDGQKPGPGCLGTWNLAVSKFSRYPRETGAAITWLTSQEQQTKRYLSNGNLPARSAVFDDGEVKKKYPYAEPFKSVFEGLKPRPVTPFYPQMSADAIQPNFGAAMSRQKPAEQAIKDMAAAIRKITGK
jgi:multiple sugar transport system substrate-binding protein